MKLGPRGVGKRNALTHVMTYANETLGQLLRVEHYRLHCVEVWPDTPYKASVLAAIRSALERLQGASAAAADAPVCMICSARRRESTVLTFPSRTAITRRAA